MEEDYSKLFLPFTVEEGAWLPMRGTKGSAGLDLYAKGDYRLRGYSATMVHTGIAVEIPQGYVGLVFARSSIASKHGIRPSNCVGVIDSDYRGEVLISLYNDRAFTYDIEDGTRVAQLVIVPYLDAMPVKVRELSNTDRGTGGFGSTGK